MVTGDADEGLVELDRALRLSPKDPRASIYLGLQAGGHLVAARYDEAAAFAREALSRQPDEPAARVLLAASLVLAGNVEQARSAWAHGPPIDVARLDRLWVIDWLRPVERDRIKKALQTLGANAGSD